ncbi:TolC family protein [Aliifodinibius sp. S!AR15-10]|uniref:TolC family protein n=1 Tax=Aliifodinibius sp. S!AR15-10 TaxID=2950437 RepID=UPI00285F9010|nr:TolC family protein [Aliifodinibius sp. S!AR15-10]MDR8393161.1 TolC family protein [Aliifodinibius sp. S!AR15-10]
MSRYIQWTLLLVLLPVIVHSQTISISLDEAVELFKQNSLQQELARYDWLRKQGEAIQYKAYPNPEVSVNREQLNAGSIDYKETTYMVSQPIELLGQPFLRSRSASKSQRAAELQFEYDRLQLIRQVKALYAEYWQLSEKLDIYNEALEVIQKAQESAKERQVEGAFSGLQVQRFNVELSRYRKQRDQVQLNLRQTGNLLATYLFSGQELGTQIQVSDSLRVIPISLQEQTLIQHALANRADLAALEQMVDASELQYKVEKRNRLPDLNLNLGYKEQSDGAQGFVIGGSIKLPIFNQNRGNVTITRAQTHSRGTELTLKRQAVRNQVETAYERVELVFNQWESMNEDSMNASMLEAARAAYQQGRYSLVELLDATQAYIDGQTMIYDTIADYNQALFELDVQTAGRISILMSSQ